MAAKSPRRSPARPAVVAALAVVWIACLLLLIIPAAPTGQRVTARFQFAGGLIAGAPVTVAGVPAGRIEKIGLGEGDIPEVTFRLEDGVRLRQGARADLRIGSQAGQLNRSVELTLGSGEPLPDGAVLPTGRTDEPVELDDALSMLTPKMRRDARTVAASLDRTLSGAGPDLGDAIAASAEQIDEIEGLASVLADDGPLISRLVAEGRQVAGAVAAERESIGGATDRLADTLAVTARRRNELRSSVDQLAPALRAATAALDEGRSALPPIRTALKQARPAARQAKETAPALAGALAAAPEALAASEQLAAQAPGQLRAIEPVVRSAQPVVRDLPETLDRFLPVLEEMRAFAPDALGWFPMLGDALASYDENGHGARLMLVLEPAPNKPAPEDVQQPGLLAAPFKRTPGVLTNEPWRDFRQSMLSADGRKESP